MERRDDPCLPVGWAPLSYRGRMRSRVAAAAVAALVAAGCASTGAHTPSHPPVATSGSPATSRSPSPTPDPSAVRPAVGLSPPRVRGLTWVPAGPSAGGRPLLYTALTDQGAVGLLWMDTSRLRFRYVPGWRIPEGSPRLPADTQPSTWVPRMLAAFNGAFMLKDHVGGYAYAGHTIAPLQPGLAAFAITTTGRITVGAWGRDIRPARDLVVVRQNLPLLIEQYQSMIRPTDISRTWGYANGNAWNANRSCLGQLADGAVVYAYGWDVRPTAMARAMVAVRARVAMMLDMNRSWPGGFVYDHRGTRVVGHRIQPDIYHSPSVYFAPYEKDFVVALAPLPAP